MPTKTDGEAASPLLCPIMDGGECMTDLCAWAQPDGECLLIQAAGDLHTIAADYRRRATARRAELPAGP